MKIKTSEATGLQLDWGLLTAAHKYPRRFSCHIVEPCGNDYRIYSHADPAVCMAKIASYKIDVRHQFYSTPELSVLACWGDEDDKAYDYVAFYGSTVAEAVARCVIAMRLGDEFEVPDELGVMS